MSQHDGNILQYITIKHILVVKSINGFYKKLKTTNHLFAAIREIFS